MKPWTAPAFSVLLMIIASGCMENDMQVALNKDGSGTILYRVFMSDEIVDMMQGMAGMAAGMAGDAGETNAPPEVGLFTEIRDSLAEQFGSGVTLESAREVTNAQGWKGLEALYAFADIREIKLHDIDPMGGDEANGGNTQQAGGQYRVEFTPGETAELKLVPIGEKPIAEEATEGKSDGEDAESPEENVMGDMMEQLPIEMLKQMLHGMRMAFRVTVNGEIVETNAKYRSEETPNLVTLVDMSMDALLEHPDAADLIRQSNGPDAAALAKLDIPGVKLEDPDKEIVIRFR